MTHGTITFEANFNKNNERKPYGYKAGADGQLFNSRRRWSTAKALNDELRHLKTLWERNGWRVEVVFAEVN